MYHIPFQIPPSFNDNPNSELYQRNWKIEPATPLPVILFIGSSNPSDVILNIEMPDYRKTFPDTYKDFYIKLKVEAEHTFFSVSGNVPIDPSKNKIVSDADLNTTSTLHFLTSNLLPGNYSGKIRYIVEGELQNGDFVEIDTESFDLSVQIISQTEMAVYPRGFVNLDHISGDPSPSQTRTIYANGVFYIETPKFINVTGFNITPHDQTDDTYIYTGSGTQEMIISIDMFHPDYRENALMVFTNPNHHLTEGIVSRRFDQPVLEVTPSEIEFLSVKELFEATFQFFYIECVGDYTITLPYFMTTGTPLSGTGSAIANIAPMHSDNFNAGTYEGKIKVTSGSITREIKVIYKVVDRVDFNLKTNRINFTLDRGGITTVYDHTNILGGISQTVSNVKADFELLVKTSPERLHRSEFSQGFRNNKTDFFTGKIVDKIIQPVDVLETVRFGSIAPSELSTAILGAVLRPLYREAEAKLMVSFTDRSTGMEVQPPKIASPVFFLKGRKPRRFENQLGIIDFHESPIRVTKNSIASFPVYNPSVSLIEVWKNGTRVQQIIRDPGDNHFNVYFVSFQKTTPGDVIDLRLRRNGNIQEGISMIQRYIVFPDGKESYHIAWENEHGVPFLMEFTGDYSFHSEYKGIVADTFQKFLEVREKTGTNRDLKFKANTGWILKSNQERIDSLLHAKRAWIVFKDGKQPISLVPQDAKITNIDSAAETYQYTIDFIINPRHEIENSPSELRD